MIGVFCAVCVLAGIVATIIYLDRHPDGGDESAALRALRQVAEAVDPERPRRWEWEGHGEGGYPQQVISQGNVALIAECYESPDHPSRIAEYIATFDPVTVLGLLDALDEARAAVDSANGDRP